MKPSRPVKRAPRMVPLRRAKDPRAAELGDFLRRRREAAGLTRQQLAAKLGVVVETISACEAGRPARHSTLHAYVRHLPGVFAHDILGFASRSAPEACDSAWDFESKSLGFSARRMLVAESGLRIEGLRPTYVSGTNPDVKRMLRCASCPAGGELLRKIEADTMELKEGERLHSWKDEARGLAYRCVGSIDLPFLLEIPVKELELKATGRGPHRLCVTNPGNMDEDVTDALYPLGVPVTKGRVVLRKPLLRLHYSLVAAETAPSRRKAFSLAQVVAEAREAAGLSIRALAARAGFSVSAVWRAETGDSDPRLSTLIGLMEGLPELNPQHILPGPPAAGEWDAEQAWRYQAQLVGVTAKSIRKLVSLEESGHRVTTIQTSGLRHRGGLAHEPCVRTPLVRALGQDLPGSLEDLQTEDNASTRVTVTRGESTDGRTQHVVRWPARLRTSGLWYERTIQSRSPIPMTGEQAQSMYGGTPPWLNGVALVVTYPIESLRIEVEFPADYSPDGVRASAWPTCVLPGPSLHVLSGAHEPRLILAGTRKEHVTLVLRVPHPLMGLTYGIAWQVS